MKRTSEAPFPYGWPGKVCYFTAAEYLEPEQVRSRDEMRRAVAAAFEGRVTIYAAWPGEFRTDLFVVDDVPALAAALGIEVAA